MTSINRIFLASISETPLAEVQGCASREQEHDSALGVVADRTHAFELLRHELDFVNHDQALAIAKQESWSRFHGLTVNGDLQIECREWAGPC